MRFRLYLSSILYSLVIFNFGFSQLDPNLFGAWHSDDNVVLFTDATFTQPIGEASFSELFPDPPPYSEEFKITFTLNESGIGNFGWMTVIHDGCGGENVDVNWNQNECEASGNVWMNAELLSYYMCQIPGGLCIFQDDVAWSTQDGYITIETSGYPGEDPIIFPYFCEDNENCILQLSLPTGGECMDMNGAIIPNVDEYLCTYMGGNWNGFVSYIQLDLNRFDNSSDYFGQWNWDLYTVTYEDFSYQNVVDSVHYWENFDDEELIVINEYNNSLIFNDDGEHIQQVSIDLNSVCIDANENFLEDIIDEELCLEVNGYWIPAEQLSMYACESNTGSCDTFFYYEWDNYQDFLFLIINGGCLNNYNEFTFLTEEDCYYNGFTWNPDINIRNPIKINFDGNTLTQYSMDTESLIPISTTYYFSGIDNCGLIGDANLDNNVNVLDVMTMVNHILEIVSLEICNYTNADLDQNETINVLDVMQVVNIILEQFAIPPTIPDFNIEINLNFHLHKILDTPRNY